MLLQWDGMEEIIDIDALVVVADSYKFDPTLLAKAIYLELDKSKEGLYIENNVKLDDSVLRELI